MSAENFASRKLLVSKKQNLLPQHVSRAAKLGDGSFQNVSAIMSLSLALNRP